MKAYQNSSLCAILQESNRLQYTSLISHTSIYLPHMLRRRRRRPPVWHTKVKRFRGKTFTKTRKNELAHWQAFRFAMFFLCFVPRSNKQHGLSIYQVAEIPFTPFFLPARSKTNRSKFLVPFHFFALLPSFLPTKKTPYETKRFGTKFFHTHTHTFPMQRADIFD